jgi:Na+-transporting NADH:ubiquinone oxidoreductase subunit NqrB
LELEVTYPCSFDAVHYPFLKTGWGFWISSFAAFPGFLVVIFQLVAPKFREHVALRSVLTLLAMPTLMLSGDDSKKI